MEGCEGMSCTSFASFVLLLIFFGQNMLLQLGHCLSRIKCILHFMNTPTSDVMAVNVSLKLMGLDIAYLSNFKI